MKKEEIMAMLYVGKKVSHQNFTCDEWMKLDGVNLLFEDGVRCSFIEFWSHRKGESWETGWFIWNEKTSK